MLTRTSREANMILIKTLRPRITGSVPMRMTMGSSLNGKSTTWSLAGPVCSVRWRACLISSRQTSPISSTITSSTRQFRYWKRATNPSTSRCNSTWSTRVGRVCKTRRPLRWFSHVWSGCQMTLSVAYTSSLLTTSTASSKSKVMKTQTSRHICSSSACARLATCSQILSSLTRLITSMTPSWSHTLSSQTGSFEWIRATRLICSMLWTWVSSKTKTSGPTCSSMCRRSTTFSHGEVSMHSLPSRRLSVGSIGWLLSMPSVTKPSIWRKWATSRSYSLRITSCRAAKEFYICLHKRRTPGCHISTSSPSFCLIWRRRSR